MPVTGVGWGGGEREITDKSLSTFSTGLNDVNFLRNSTKNLIEFTLWK